MPRNGSGIAERLPNTNAVSGRTIESADFEATANDIYAILNTATPQALGGTGFSSWGDAKQDVLADVISVSDASYAKRSNNLSDLSNAATARTNLGLTDTAISPSTIAGKAMMAAASATAQTALLDAATTSLKGLMSSSDKTKLNGLTTVSVIEVDLGILTGALQTAAHGISGGPTFIAPFLRCETSDLGYPVGFNMPIAINGDQLNSTGVFAGFTTTQVMARVSNQIAFVRYDTGATAYGNPSSWRVIIRCVKIG